MDIPSPNYLDALLYLDSSALAELNPPYGYADLICFEPTVKPSKSTLDQAIIDIKKLDCKNEAKKRIAEYDWVIDTETTPDLLNREDFIAYRSELRQLILNPVENPVFPEIPQEEWA